MGEERLSVIKALGRSLECRGIWVVLHSVKELPVFYYQDGFGLQVVVVCGVFVDNSFHYVWCTVKPFKEEVYRLPAPYRVPCLPGKRFKVTDILVDVGEFELESVKGGFGRFLFHRVCVLLFEPC